MDPRWKTASASLTYPTIHLNGTSVGELQRQVEKAGRDLRKAIDSLGDMAPHGRDYYPQGGDAIRKATREHNERVDKLTSVQDDLEDIHRYLTGGYEELGPREYPEKYASDKEAGFDYFPWLKRNADVADSRMEDVWQAVSQLVASMDSMVNRSVVLDAAYEQAYKTQDSLAIARRNVQALRAEMARAIRDLK